MNNPVHHYAPCSYLPRIAKSGVLRPSNAKADSEKPLLWFSANQRWEPTATKMWADKSGNIVRLSLEQQLELVGCCRFTLTADDSRLMPWAIACKFAGTSFTNKRKMEAAGLRLGARPLDWLAIDGEIPLTELGFSVFDGRAWHPADIAETAKSWAVK
jgi:hypothetical protein